MTYMGHGNEEFRIRSTFGGNEKWVVSGSEAKDGEVLVWDTVGGGVIQRVLVKETDGVARKMVVDSQGKEKKRRNVISCVAWKNDGRGDQWCCAGTDGVVTVFGSGP
jgi:mitogen-activated protein kinase organizer 1